MNEAFVPFFQYLLIVPASFLCTLPLEKSFRCPPARLYPATVAGCVLFCALAALLNAFVFPLYADWVGVAAAVAALLLCFRLTDASAMKLVNVFVNAIAFFCFAGFAGYLMESFVNPTGNAWDPCYEGVWVQWATLLALLSALGRMLRRRNAWIVAHYHEASVWRITWLIPAIIAACNMVMVPRSYQTMHVGRVFFVTFVIEGVLLTLLIVFNIVFYLMARRSVESAALEKRAALLEIQADQYRKLKANMEQTARQRHDFRHSIRAMDELAKQGDLAGLRRFAREYTARLEEISDETYCENPALNALLGYYAAIAKASGIRTRLQIALPERLPVAEVDLCSLMGNLFENAMDACRRVPPHERRLAISAEMRGGCVYVVSTNAFDGCVKLRGGQYLSTKHGGEGVGLSSIRAVAERYRGAMSAHHQGSEFCVDVCMKADVGNP